MEKRSIFELTIRDGVVRLPGVGYILACDPKLEEREVPHAFQFKWDAGSFSQGSFNFDAHTICAISDPEPGFVLLAGFGEYAVSTKREKIVGKIFDGLVKRENYGMFRVVTAIRGKAYAAGHRGMVYRLDEIGKWVRLDKGLPDNFKITAIDGFDAGDLYAVGYKGALWHFDGGNWFEISLPTNINLTAVKCAGDGKVYVGGYNGILICGRMNTWDILVENETEETIWSLEWFADKMYISTMLFVYQLKAGKLDLVYFDDEPPDTCYHLSSAEGILWSIGASDVMSFDGKIWTRIV